MRDYLKRAIERKVDCLISMESEEGMCSYLGAREHVELPRLFDDPVSVTEL
jgi:hypothetical protein